MRDLRLLQAQAGKFVQRFHNERKTKLTMLLESERWKQADVPLEFQSLVTYVYEKKCFPLKIFTCEDDTKSDGVETFIVVGDEKFAVVGTALMLIQMIHEYCR